MERQEVENWLKTEEGFNWLEEKKSGLKNKNVELLAEIKKLNERLNGATENSNAISEKFNNLEMILKNDYIQNIFKNGLVFPECNNFVLSEIEKLAECEGGFTSVNDNGNFSMITKSGKTFSDYFESWKGTEVAKRFLKNPSVGGGATGSGSVHYSTDFSKLSAEEVSNSLNSAEGKAELQNALTNRSF